MRPGVRNFAPSGLKQGGRLFARKHLSSSRCGPEASSGGRLTWHLLNIPRFADAVTLPGFRKLRMLRASEAREGHNEIRLGAPCRQEKFSPRAMQGDPGPPEGTRACSQDAGRLFQSQAQICQAHSKVVRNWAHFGPAGAGRILTRVGATSTDVCQTFDHIRRDLAFFSILTQAWPR